MTRHLRNLGGSNAFSGDPRHPLDGPEFVLQRKLRDTRINERARSRGMVLYLGAYSVNYRNNRTPLAEWFDDPAWTTAVLPALRDLAGAAHILGFEGIAFDQELYQQDQGSTATWSWDYPGRTRPEQEVRAAVKARGAQMMTAILGAFPDVEIIDYHSWFPESWNELVQQEVNGKANAYAKSTQIDFWDGLTSVKGFRAIRFMDATFYKTPHLTGVSWDTALQYDFSRVFSLFSRRLSNWAYASTRIHRSPFAWISSGETGFEAARSPEYVAAQLQAFRRWGLGGTFANYAFGGLSGFDYGPYEAGMRAAAQPGVVDPVPPTLQVASISVVNGVATITGTADDDHAVRVVGWATDDGAAGTASMNWRIRSGTPRAGYDAETEWTFTLPVGRAARTLTIGVQDVKGNVTSQVVRCQPVDARGRVRSDRRRVTGCRGRRSGSGARGLQPRTRRGTPDPRPRTAPASCSSGGRGELHPRRTRATPWRSPARPCDEQCTRPARLSRIDAVSKEVTRVPRPRLRDGCRRVA